MPLLIPAVGENKLLEFQLGKATPGDQTLKLYTNNITPGDSDTAATYTEMTGLGYAAKTLSKGSWSVSQVSSVAEGVYAQQTFSFNAGTAATIYGYFVVDSTSGVLLWSERFATSKTVQNQGDEIKITPKFTYSKA